MTEKLCLLLILFFYLSISFAARTDQAQFPPFPEKPPDAASANVFADKTYQNLKSTGVTTLKGTKVLQNTLIGGRVKMVQAELNQLEIQGFAEMEGSTIAGTSFVYGLLKARDSTFFGPLIISANLLELDNCQTATIKFNKLNRLADQSLYLKGNTKVNGDIVFPSRKGKVYLGPNAEITGNVFGGQIIGQPAHANP